jgi:hypothetical protein
VLLAVEISGLVVEAVATKLRVPSGVPPLAVTVKTIRSRYSIE